jgi:hypothetical protein
MIFIFGYSLYFITLAKRSIKMSIEFIEFILGIIFTGLVGWLGILYARKIRDRVNIKLLGENYLSLLSTFNDQFNSLRFEVYQLPTNTNVYYYKFSLINTGTKDIDKPKIFEPVEVAFPDGCKIIESKINKTSSDKIHLSITPQNNKLTINWDLLKPNESLTIDTLIESAGILAQPEFEKKVIINHRIADLAKIDLINVSDIPKKPINNFVTNHLFNLLVFIGFIVLLSFAEYNAIRNYNRPPIKIDYDLLLKSNLQPVQIKSYDTAHAYLVQGSNSSVYPISRFNDLVLLKPHIYFEERDMSGMIVIGFLLALTIFGTIVTAQQANTEYKKMMFLKRLKGQV